MPIFLWSVVVSQATGPSRWHRRATHASLGGLFAQPALELLGGHDLDGERHEGVVQSAELRAHAVVGAGGRGAHVEHVHVTRDRVALEQEVGHPEGVDHVVRGEFDADGFAHRQPQLGPGDALPARMAQDHDAFVGEGEPPSPLVRLDVQRDVRVGRDRRDAVVAAHRKGEQRHHDHHRDRRVDDLERDVRVELAAERRVVVASPTPVAQERPPQQPVHDRRDPDRGPEEDLPQAEDLLALARTAPRHAERRRARRGRDRDRRHEAHPPATRHGEVRS